MKHAHKVVRNRVRAERGNGRYRRKFHAAQFTGRWKYVPSFCWCEPLRRRAVHGKRIIKMVKNTTLRVLYP